MHAYNNAQTLHAIRQHLYLSMFQAVMPNHTTGAGLAFTALRIETKQALDLSQQIDYSSQAYLTMSKMSW